MADQPALEPAATASTWGTPEDYDAALLVVVLPEDGVGQMWVKGYVEDEAVATWLHDVADRIAAGAHRVPSTG